MLIITDILLNFPLLLMVRKPSVFFLLIHVYSLINELDIKIYLNL